MRSRGRWRPTTPIRDRRRSASSSLYQSIRKPRLRIDAATSNGWFDLRPDEAQFGELPDEDQVLLAGGTPEPEDPLETLTGGVLDIKEGKLVGEVGVALVEYTPPHFKTIVCTSPPLASFSTSPNLTERFPVFGSRFAWPTTAPVAIRSHCGEGSRRTGHSFVPWSAAFLARP